MPVNSLDLETMNQIVVDLYIPMVAQEHGDLGIHALKKLLGAIKRIYQRIAPEMHKGPIVIFKAIHGDVNLIPEISISVYDYDALPQLVHDSFMIQVLDNGQLLLWNDLEPDVRDLASRAVVYKYTREAEFFWAQKSCKQVPKLVSTYASMFAIPTFSDLRDALEHYKTMFVRHCSCKILAAVWHDEKRFFLKNAQESVMRV